MIGRYRFLAVVVCLCVVPRLFAAPSAREKEWAFLIFLNGHNNLAPYSDLNINQLETIGSTKDIDVIVQWGKSGNDKTYRLRVEKDTDTEKVTSPILESLPRVDMGDYKNLVEFVRWSKARFPAKRYFISFWNHGSGWYRSTATRGVSYDDYSGNHITTEQMGIGLREIASIIGHKVEIVGADACLMAMAEVASEMADSVEYFVASEETEPALGWPYDKFLERWALKPTASGAEVGRYLVEEYQKSLSGNKDITLSTLDLKKLPDLWNSLRKLSDTVSSISVDKLLVLDNAVSSSKIFAYHDYVDLGDWVKRARAAIGSSNEFGFLGELERIILDTVVANQTSTDCAEAHGVSFWVPKSQSKYDQYISRYKELRFAKETRWHEALSLFLNLPDNVTDFSVSWLRTDYRIFILE